MCLRCLPVAVWGWWQVWGKFHVLIAPSIKRATRPPSDGDPDIFLRKTIYASLHAINTSRLALYSQKRQDLKISFFHLEKVISRAPEYNSKRVKATTKPQSIRQSASLLNQSINAHAHDAVISLIHALQSNLFAPCNAASAVTPVPVSMAIGLVRQLRP